MNPANNWQNLKFKIMGLSLAYAYRNDPKFLDRYASDQGLHCLPFRLDRLDSLLYGRAT